MLKRRTPEQIAANSFDCDLYRLIRLAKEYGWLDVTMKLSDARGIVRVKMHPVDLEMTVG